MNQVAGTTQGTAAKVTGPAGAGSLIAALTYTLTGTFLWRFRATVYIDGTVTAADEDNIQLGWLSGSVNAIEKVAVPANAVGVPVQYEMWVVGMPATSFTVSAASVAAGGASAVYHAALEATPFMIG